MINGRDIFADKHRVKAGTTKCRSAQYVLLYLRATTGKREQASFNWSAKDNLGMIRAKLT